MSIYRTENNNIFNTNLASRSYQEETDWNGNNHISRATGSQWEHETLYRSSKGRWYIEHTSQWQGSLPSARDVTEKEAAEWLVLNGHELPQELADATKPVGVGGGTILVT